MSRGAYAAVGGVVATLVVAGLVWVWKRARSSAQAEAPCKFEKGTEVLQSLWDEMDERERVVMEAALDQIADYVDGCTDLDKLQRFNNVMADAITSCVSPEEAERQMVAISGISGCEVFIASIRNRQHGRQAPV
jgi:hypothetical protein